MSSTRFQTCLKAVLKHEGGYVDHPADPGGATNRGITQARLDEWRSSHGQTEKSVREITDEEVHDIYQARYWRPVHAFELPRGLDYCAFDYAVHSGHPKAIKDLQRVLRVTVDGAFGPETRAAVADADATQTIKQYCAKRGSFLQSLKHYKTFGKGWMRRLAEVEATALRSVSSTNDLFNESRTASSNAAATATGSIGASGGAIMTVPLPDGTPAGVVALAFIVIAAGLAFHSYRQGQRSLALGNAARANLADELENSND